jgi:hypothetical protein
MSTALAIAGVTAVLRDFLNDGLVNHDATSVLGSSVSVSALPPDRILSGTGAEATQLNLFLYNVTPNRGWASEGLPSRDGSGTQRLSNPPLALNLHYLLSAYCATELHAEIVLGYAMQLLHDTPVLDRKAIATALNPSPDVGSVLPSTLRALSECGLAEQIEQIKLAPEYLGTEEMSKLWTAMASHYRPTVVYVASVVLIQSTRPTRSGLPVLTRGPIDDSGRERGVTVLASLLAPFPTIDSVVPEGRQPAATVGSAVTLGGHHLGGISRAVQLSNLVLGIEREVRIDDSVAASSLSFDVPDVPAGVYALSLRLVRPDESEPRTSNRVALSVAPHITTPLPMTVARDAQGTATIVLTCSPAILPSQRTSLLLGDTEIVREPIVESSASVSFVLESALPGDRLIRLRVDGIETALVDRAATPPRFFDHRVTIQ